MEIAAEDKYFVIEQCGEALRSIVRALFAVKEARDRVGVKSLGSGEIIGICHNGMVLCLDVVLHLLNISEIGSEGTCRLLLAYLALHPSKCKCTEYLLLDYSNGWYFDLLCKLKDKDSQTPNLRHMELARRCWANGVPSLSVIPLSELWRIASYLRTDLGWG